MALYIGRNTAVTFATVALNTNYRSASVEESIELIDKSSGADTHKSYLGGLKETGFSLEFLIDGTASWVVVAPGTEGTLAYSPEGTAAGKPKYTAIAMVASRSRENPYNEIVKATAEFQLQATWTEGTN